MSIELWIKEFKLAIVNEDISKIGKLIDKAPINNDFESNKMMLILVQQATRIVENRKKYLSFEMQKVKQHINYIGKEANRKDIALVS